MLLSYDINMFINKLVVIKHYGQLCILQASSAFAVDRKEWIRSTDMPDLDTLATVEINEGAACRLDRRLKRFINSESFQVCMLKKLLNIIERMIRVDYARYTVS